MQRHDELVAAIQYCYAEVPKEWVNRLDVAEEALNGLKPMENGNPMPFITYFLFHLNSGKLGSMVFLNSLISTANIAAFEKEALYMKNTAAVEAVVDEKNFKSEVEAFDDMEKAIENPHLDISPLYRYMAAVQNNYFVLITDDLFELAKKNLYANPYRFTAYGEELKDYMPITWEGVYFK